MTDIKQSWNIRLIKDNPTFPFLLIDNWYTPEEEKNVWKELEFYGSNPIDTAQDGIVAKYEDGKSKGMHNRFYIDKIYTDEGKRQSNILKYNYKHELLELHHNVNECGHYARQFFSSNSMSTFISLYNNNDYYDHHWDNAFWTNLIWFVEEPKNFSGGDLEFEENNTTIKLKHNRAVLFPSMYLHKSTQLIGDGKKFTITNFFLI
tara:strand:+ start:326 stop:940 length:615 start_codon:yes stop_codon:yes gene_type:complete